MKYGDPETVENALNKSCQKIFNKHRFAGTALTTHCTKAR
jgi:hypothetical protein